MPRRGWSTIAVDGKAWGRALDCLVRWFGGRSWRRGSLPQFGRRLKGRSGRTRRRGHRSFKAIRKNGGTGKRQQSGHAGLDMDCGASVICKDEQARWHSSEPFCRTRNSQHCCEFCRRTLGAHIANFKNPRRRLPARACPANTRWAGELRCWRSRASLRQAGNP